MEEKGFKVVGVQIIPKEKVGVRPMVQQIADKEVCYSYSLFENMILPVNKEFEAHLRYEDSKKKATRSFMIVGLMDYVPKSDIMGNILFNPSRSLSLNVMDELQSLVRTVN